MAGAAGLIGRKRWDCSGNAWAALCPWPCVSTEHGVFPLCGLNSAHAGVSGPLPRSPSTDPPSISPAAGCCGADEQPLEPKAFAVLALLAGTPGRVFTRDEILDAIWGHRNVTPGVLNRVMTLLRHALGEDAQAAPPAHRAWRGLPLRPSRTRARRQAKPCRHPNRKRRRCRRRPRHARRASDRRAIPAPGCGCCRCWQCSPSPAGNGGRVRCRPRPKPGDGAQHRRAAPGQCQQRRGSCTSPTGCRRT